ncbi:MAG: AMP-dependent synthetase/ligase [Acidobacteriota bacterium]
MSFLEQILAQLAKAQESPVLEELREARNAPVTGGELLEMVGKARAFLSTRGLNQGDRCALLAHNSVQWVATNLAMMAEGLIVVPLYARQAPAELVAMMKDCMPALICCGDTDLSDGIRRTWPDGPNHVLFERVFANKSTAAGRVTLADSDPVTIIYTSGTSGEAKGVILTAGNIAHMLGCTSGRLDELMGPQPAPDRIFHYLPFCFAGSWIMLLTCLLRGSQLKLNTDLSRIAADMRNAEPDYFLNVPALLERMRKAVDEQLWKAGGAAEAIYSRAKGAWARQHDGGPKFLDSLWLKTANKIVFPTIRNKMLGANLKALICGSAPLNVETQLFFLMLGLPVLQVYGLTETTAICTMDDPHHVIPGRVGPAISGIEMKLGDNDEIIVRGPNIFPGYWNRPEESAKVLRNGWFHTGDQGDKDGGGNWRIIGRIKNLIILASGHNIAPEPIEDELLEEIPGAQQVVLVGNGKGYLSAIVTGDLNHTVVQEAIDRVNPQLPHYKQVRAFHVRKEPFTIDNGLLTANGKLRRDLIAAELKNEIDELYAARQAS